MQIVCALSELIPVSKKRVVPDNVQFCQNDIKVMDGEYDLAKNWGRRLQVLKTTTSQSESSKISIYFLKDYESVSDSLESRTRALINHPDFSDLLYEKLEDDFPEMTKKEFVEVSEEQEYPEIKVLKYHVNFTRVEIKLNLTNINGFIAVGLEKINKKHL